MSSTENTIQFVVYICTEQLVDVAVNMQENVDLYATTTVELEVEL